MSSLIEYIPLFKTIHIIGFVSWFAGMFYLGRLFVYHAEAKDKPQPDAGILQAQYSLMQWRVYKIIINPAMIITWVFGLLMLAAYGVDWLKLNAWMHIKLTLLLLLTGYHGYSKGIIRKLEKGLLPMSGYGFRLFNEVPTILLVGITALAVFGKVGQLNYGIWGGSVLAFGLLVFFGARAYKQRREGK